MVWRRDTSGKSPTSKEKKYRTEGIHFNQYYTAHCTASVMMNIRRFANIFSRSYNNNNNHIDKSKHDGVPTYPSGWWK